MLIKEYRIPMPLTLAEYKIAQLYMIQKKSRQESEGEGSGVEIIENKPYTKEDTGEKGQYTYKIYHIERHIPRWCRSLVPSEATQVHEESWNAYPYTRTKFSCPFIEKFLLDIETYFYQDGGNRENVFNLKGTEIRNKDIDFIDIVNDSLSGSDYKEEEDPKVFKSGKTGRGPLKSDWRKSSNGSVMCAYKLCKVEFRYWGMQSKVERFIHDYALRRVMLRAHRQAWAWQDEWCDLTMDDIRRLEKEAQIELWKKLGKPLPESSEEEDADLKGGEADDEASQFNLKGVASEPVKELTKPVNEEIKLSAHKRKRLHKRLSHEVAHSGSNSEDNDISTPVHRFHLEALEKKISSDSEDEYLDAVETITALQEDDDGDYLSTKEDQPSVTGGDEGSFYDAHSTIEEAVGALHSDYLFLVLQGGSMFKQDHHSYKYNFNVIQNKMESVFHSILPQSSQQIYLLPIYCPPLCDNALATIKNLNVSLSNSSLPGSREDSSSSGESGTYLQNQWLPALAVAMMATTGSDYQTHLETIICRLNQIYENFASSRVGSNFKGKICILADCIGAVAMYDILAKPLDVWSDEQACTPTPQMSLSTILQTSKASRGEKLHSLKFHVSHFFAFGSPLGTILANRIQQMQPPHGIPLKPCCDKFYNLMYSGDPLASRVEPLLANEFIHITPVWIPKKTLVLAQGLPSALMEAFDSCRELFVMQDYTGDHTGIAESLVNTLSDSEDHMSTESTTDNDNSDVPGQSRVSQILKWWWSENRMDYVMSSPNDLNSIPVASLSNVLHSRYWEAKEMVLFILNTVILNEAQRLPCHGDVPSKQEITPFFAVAPSGQWLKRTTYLKIKGLSPNHRGQDSIVLIDGEQTVSARFTYGPFSFTCLDKEQVNVYILTNPPNGIWVLFDTVITDKQGRVTYCIPKEKQLSEGMYPIKFVVRGDNSSADCHMAVVHHRTNASVFSIDGSFAATFTVTGKDPKLISGSAEVVWHYQSVGHLVIYISSRPEFQKETVVRWLETHNFPLGILSFSESISKDLSQHKKMYLGRLIKENKITIRAAYGALKDLQLYQDLGLQPDQIFIINKGQTKTARKTTKNVYQVIEDNYQLHTQNLVSSKQPLDQQNMHHSSLRGAYLSFQMPPNTGHNPSETRKVKSRT